MFWCKERLWPQLMRLKLVNGSVNRVMLHCQCHPLRAVKPAITALPRKHTEIKHLKQIINSLIKLAQTKQASPAVSFNHSYIKVWGLLVCWLMGVFCMFSFFKANSWQYLKTESEEKLREISLWGIVVEHKALIRQCPEKSIEMKQGNGCGRCVE